MVLVTVGLHLVQRAGFSVDKQTIVQKTTDVSLNDFIARYESGDFMQIIEEDAQSLK